MLLKVGDIMKKKTMLPLIHENQKVSEAILEMTSKGEGCVGILSNKGLLKGIITDGDLRRNMDTLLNMTAKEVMTSKPHVIEPDSLVTESLRIMNSKKITCLFIVEKNKPIGILHIHDCIRAGTK